MLSIGQLDRRIELQTPIYTQDRFGEEVITYETFSSLWAHVDWKSSRRKEESQEQVQGTDVVFYIRNVGFFAQLYGLLGSSRIVYDSQTYIIHGWKQIDGREKFLEIETKVKDNLWTN